MAKIKILLVGEFGNRENWKHELGDGYEYFEVGTMMDVVDSLKKNQDLQQLLVQDNLPLFYPARVIPEIPKEFEVVKEHPLKRGETLIVYARKHGLIDSDKPADLVSVSPEIHKDLPEEVTRLFDAGKNIADQMQVNLRGGSDKPKGPRQLGK